MPEISEDRMFVVPNANLTVLTFGNDLVRVLAFGELTSEFKPDNMEHYIHDLLLVGYVEVEGHGF